MRAMREVDHEDCENKDGSKAMNEEGATGGSDESFHECGQCRALVRRTRSLEEEARDLRAYVGELLTVIMECAPNALEKKKY